MNPYRCPHCKQTGKVENLELDIAVLNCGYCGVSSFYTWCEPCGVGLANTANVNAEPNTLTCSECETALVVPAEVYSNPLRIHALTEAERAALKPRFGWLPVIALIIGVAVAIYLSR